MPPIFKMIVVTIGAFLFALPISLSVLIGHSFSSRVARFWIYIISFGTGLLSLILRAGLDHVLAWMWIAAYRFAAVGSLALLEWKFQPKCRPCWRGLAATIAVQLGVTIGTVIIYSTSYFTFAYFVIL